MFIDFTTVVKYAWMAYDTSRAIKSITDISAMVSTNHVYKVLLTNGSFVIAKITYFGRFEHFVEDHTIINVLANNLPAPFENFLARSLISGTDLFVHRFQNKFVDAWVVFYKPIKISKRLPKRFDDEQINAMGKQFATFHQVCTDIRNTLPNSSKTLQTDIHDLLYSIQSEDHEHRRYFDLLKRNCELFLENTDKLGADKFPKIPVFVDWNIGNFSVTRTYKLFSRWDYDWFRMSSRILDFYFLSRIVSDIGDRTIFTYNIGTLMESRFLQFLKSYHQEYPLQKNEVLFMKEAYRFFILHYVIKYGRYFFHEMYANKLQKEALEQHLPSIDNFDADRILRALNI
ncbi:MAG: hypothetical protein R3E32_19615 [Chitinophagales bacterium]